MHNLESGLVSHLKPIFLLAILLDANRDLKISDQIIYNKLDLYRYEADKRKYGDHMTVWMKKK